MQCPPQCMAEGVQTLVLLLAPFAPHMAEELWHQLGHATSVHQAAWPVYDPEALVADEITPGHSNHGQNPRHYRCAGQF